MIQARYPLSKIRVGFFELVEKLARFGKSSAYQHLQLEIHDSKQHLYFKFSWSIARCRLLVIFILKLTSRTQVFYLEDWQTSYLGSSAKLILQEVEVTVQFHFFTRNSRRSLVQLREISDIGSSARQFFTEDLDHPFLTNGWNLFLLFI